MTPDSPPAPKPKSGLSIIARILLVVLAVAGFGYRGWIAYRAFRPDHSHLVIVPPDGWKERPDSSKDPSEYSILAKDPLEAMCLLKRWKIHSAPSDFPRLVERIASAFSPKVRDQLASEHHEIASFTGPHCEGSYTIFAMKSSPLDQKHQRLAVLFLLSADGSEWSGNFNGTPENWAKALEMLKGIRKE